MRRQDEFAVGHQAALSRALLVPAGRQRAQPQLVAGPLGRHVQPVQQFEVEPPRHEEDAAKLPRPAAGQRPGAGVQQYSIVLLEERRRRGRGLTGTA